MNSHQWLEARQTCREALKQEERSPTIAEARAIAEKFKATGQIWFGRSSEAMGRQVLDRKYDRSRRRSNYAPVRA